MKIYTNKMSNSEKKQLEESGESFLFADDVSFAERIRIGYKLSLIAYGYTLENAPALDRTVFSMKKLFDVNE